MPARRRSMSSSPVIESSFPDRSLPRPTPSVSRPSLSLSSVAVSLATSTGQRRGVPAVDLVGGDPQALSRHAADESSGEQAVVAAEQHPRGNGRPRRKRRRLPQPCLGLPPAPPQRLGRQLRGNVLIEERDVV